jgi:low affinity Fe/Cu permease
VTKTPKPQPLPTPIGDTVSTWVAKAAAQPLTQAAVVTFCLLWWFAGLPTDILTATLSILAITLTQMVLNSQRIREEDDHRRDVAMHAKLDELLRAEKYARKELAGIEELEAEEIAELKREISTSAAARDGHSSPRT